MLNNLGGLTTLEMNILAKEVIAYVEELGVRVVRAYTGMYMTSLESAGVSVCLLKVDDKVLGYLDAPTNAPAWTKPYCPSMPRTTPSELEPVVSKHRPDDKQLLADKQICALNPAERELFRSCLVVACESILSHEKELDKLDSESGDGDCGTTLAAGARGILAYLGTRPSMEYPGLVFRQLSHVVSGSMGGSSGALYSLLLLGASRAFELLTGFKAWVAALELGIKLTAKYSMAHIGDRTMFDPLDAALTVLRRNTADYKPEMLPAILSATVEAVQTTTAATRTMRAKAGRASYVNPDMLKNPDPGARAVEIWMSQAIHALLSSNGGSATARPQTLR